jgi:hypothetical protein
MTTTTQTLTQSVGSLGLRGSTHPLSRNYSLDEFEHFEVTPVIGEEFASKQVQLSQLIQDDKFIKDLAVLGGSSFQTPLTSVSQRGVVFFRGQDINLEQQKVLGAKLGELSGKPKESGLHIHPTTAVGSDKGDEISV